MSYKLHDGTKELEEGTHKFYIYLFVTIYCNMHYFFGSFLGTSMLEDSVRLLSDTEDVTTGTLQELNRQNDVIAHSRNTV